MRRGDSNVWDDVYHRLGRRGKNYKNIHCGLRRLPFDEFPLNNKPKTGADDRGEYVEKLQPTGSPGGCNSIVLGAKALSCRLIKNC
jgi:hypothetical protein